MVEVTKKVKIYFFIYPIPTESNETVLTQMGAVNAIYSYTLVAIL